MSWIRKLTPLVFLAVAGLFFYLLLSTSFNEADDVVNLHFVLSHSYTTLLNIPFMDDQNAIMFRPGLAVIQKALQTFSKSHWMALRVFQVTLTSLFLAMIYTFLKKKKYEPIAIFTGLFYVLSSPFLFAPFVTYGYVGALVLLPGLCLTLIALNQKNSSTSLSIAGLLLCAIGPYIQEFGLLFIPLWAPYFLRHKKHLYATLTVLSLILYFVLRHHILGPGHSAEPFSHGTGFGTQILEPDVLNAQFNGFKAYVMYLYTLLAQTGNLLFSQPNYGYFSLTPFPLLKVFRLFLFSTSSLTIFVITVKYWRKESALLTVLWGIIVMNLPLSFQYARPRILIFASVAYAVLLALSTQKLIEINTAFTKRLAIALLLGWAIHTGDPIGHVWHDKKSNHAWYTTQPEPLRGPLSTYKDIQSHVH